MMMPRPISIIQLAQLQKNMRELSGLSQFNDAYMDAMMFPEEE